MNYTNLSQDEVEDRLYNHDEAVWNDRLKREVIEPRDVLYWLDAFGDLSLAINCQGLPKDLPSDVVRRVDEYDVYNDWAGEVESHCCPVCSRALYEFDTGIASWLIDKYGGEHTEEASILCDSAGLYWDSTGEHRFLCAVCQRDNEFGRFAEQWGVKVFYGEHDEWYHFRHRNGVIAHDSMGSDDKRCSPRNIRDADGELVRPRDIESAFAAPNWRELDGMIERLGFTEITPADVRVDVPGLRRAERYAEEIMAGWAKSPHEDARFREGHPDFDFTYFIEDGKHFFCPTADRETVLYHLEDQVLMQGGTIEQVREHRCVT